MPQCVVITWERDICLGTLIVLYGIIKSIAECYEIDLLDI